MSGIYTWGIALLLLAGHVQADDNGRSSEDARVGLTFHESTVEGVPWPGEAWAENHLGGPVEIMLHPITTDVPVSDPQLPARALLKPFERRLITRLRHTPVRNLRVQVIPGTPNAKPRDVEYAYPLQTRSLRIEQGWGGTFSHGDAQNRYAIDLAVDIGTPVIAARAGTVMEVESNFDHAGLNAETYAGSANFVRIVHEDGTMAVYAHLKSGDALVHVGQRVRQGETIGLSGNTGFSAGPHLHFVVQVNRGMSLESIPFRMFGPQGILRFSEAVTVTPLHEGDAGSAQDTVPGQRPKHVQKR